MNYDDPHTAQAIVATYVQTLEAHGAANSYPASARTLPYPKPTIKGAIVTCRATLERTGQLTDELHEFLESAYVALADYIDDELARALTEYREATVALETQPRVANERLRTHAWQRVAATGRLAGEIARSIAQEGVTLRHEFRAAARLEPEAL